MKKIQNIIKVIIIIIIIFGAIFLVIKGIGYAKNANNSYSEDKLKKTENKEKRMSSNSTDTTIESTQESNTNSSSNNTNTTNTNVTNKNNNSTTNNMTSTGSKKRLVTTDPIYEYSCPDGKLAKRGDKCNVKSYVDAEKKYYCNEGTLEGDKCKINDNYVSANYNYVCPTSAYNLVDSKCERNEQRDPNFKISCPKGYGYMQSPNDKNLMTCVKLEE